MTTTTTSPTQIADYANAVRTALGDLSPEQAHAVLDGLDEHLTEIAADGPDDLVDVLGTPSAYAAELRASAGLGSATTPTAPATATTPRVAPSSTTSTPPPDADQPIDGLSSPPVEPTPSSRLHLGDGRTSISRITMVVVLSVLAITVIRVSKPIMGLEVVLGALGVASVWWGLRALGARANLTGAMQRRLPAALGATALVLAVLVGGLIAGNHTVDRVIYNGGVSSPSRSTVPTATGGLVMVLPNVIGFDADAAIAVLGALGLEPVVRNAGAGPTILAMAPGPGTPLMPPGSVIVLTAGPLSPRQTIPDTPPATVDSTALNTTAATSIITADTAVATATADTTAAPTAPASTTTPVSAPPTTTAPGVERTASVP